MKTQCSDKNTETTDDAKLMNDLQRLSRSVDDDFTCRLSKVVTREYAQVLIYSEADALTGEILLTLFGKLIQARLVGGNDFVHRFARARTLAAPCHHYLIFCAKKKEFIG